MKSLILLLFLIVILSHYAKAEGVSFTCKMGRTDKTMNVHNKFEVGRFQTQYITSQGNTAVIVIEDVSNPNSVDDYVITTDGKHTFTQPLYCKRR